MLNPYAKKLQRLVAVWWRYAKKLCFLCTHCTVYVCIGWPVSMSE